jgi:alpha-L-arabinofuranosidase
MKRIFLFVLILFSIFLIVIFNVPEESKSQDKTVNNSKKFEKLKDWKSGEIAQIRIYDESLGKINKDVLGKNVLGHEYIKAAGSSRGHKYSMKGAGLWDPEEKKPVEEVAKFLKNTGSKTVRWPGGCGSHRFNWKKTVGPLDKRPDQAYGLPEFIKVCRNINAEPMITIAVYWGSAQDAADLVEYLNSPVGANPNGGKDWAAVREAGGYKEPFNIKWFEYGNESYHGPHSPNSGAGHSIGLTSKEYSENYLKYQKAMKAVDSNVKLGALFKNENKPWIAYWSQDVLNRTCKTADYYIHHTYLPGYDLNDDFLKAKDLFKLSFASARQMNLVYKELNSRIAAATDRKIQIAITEYNGSFIQNDPVPYRLCLGNAVIVADFIREMLNPEHQILSAQYWQFSNEYWGMIKGYEAPYLIRPTYYTYALYNKYLGSKYIKSQVYSDSYESKGGFSVLPAMGKKAKKKFVQKLKFEENWEFKENPDVDFKVLKDGTLYTKIKTNDKFNLYQASFEIPAKPNTAYKIIAEVKTSGFKKKGAGIGVGDSRGWDTTKSQSASNFVATTDWQVVECVYFTLADTKSIDIMVRRYSTPEAGEVWLKNIKVEEYERPNSGEVPYVDTVVSEDEDGNTYLILINRNIEKAEKLRIYGRKSRSVTAETLTGPSVDATNEKDPNNVIIKKLQVEVKDGYFEIVLPKHSVTGVKISKCRLRVSSS